MDWFAVSVKPRHEKSVSKTFELKNLESLLPLYRARQRKTVESHVSFLLEREKLPS
jgi:hypothetical protein